MVVNISRSAEETKALGLAFGQKLPANSIVCFYGDLGAGKTTFIKGLAVGILGHSNVEIMSPTFTYLNIYSGNKTLYHFDLYRLHHADEFLSMGFDEMFERGGVCCIEWAEKISCLDFTCSYRVCMVNLGLDNREIEIKEIEK